MTTANLNVRPAIVPGTVAPSATNLVLLFALDRMPVSARQLVCHWHRDADGRLVCAWEPDGIVNLSRGGILLPSVARRFGAEKSLARL